MSNKEKEKKYDKLVRLAKDKSKKREEEVLKGINKMIDDSKDISFYSVKEETGASRSYLYKNEKIREKIEKERNLKRIDKKTDKSKDVIIKTLKMEVSQLKTYLKYKKMYEDLLIENEKLKEKLNIMYTEYYKK